MAIFFITDGFHCGYPDVVTVDIKESFIGAKTAMDSDSLESIVFNAFLLAFRLPQRPARKKKDHQKVSWAFNPCKSRYLYG